MNILAWKHDHAAQKKRSLNEIALLIKQRLHSFLRIIFNTPITYCYKSSATSFKSHVEKVTLLVVFWVVQPKSMLRFLNSLDSLKKKKKESDFFENSQQEHKSVYYSLGLGNVELVLQYRYQQM